MAKSTPDSLILHERFLYSKETGLVTYRKSKGTAKAGDLAGYVNHRGYKKVCIDGEHYFMHRIIWKMTHGADACGEIDHINRNRKDNRLENLRDVTSKENQLNREKPRGSEFVGVYYNPSKNKWQARIDVHIGWFDKPEDAMGARSKALSKISSLKLSD